MDRPSAACQAQTFHHVWARGSVSAFQSNKCAFLATVTPSGACCRYVLPDVTQKERKLKFPLLTTEARQGRRLRC